MWIFLRERRDAHSPRSNDVFLCKINSCNHLNPQHSRFMLERRHKRKILVCLFNSHEAWKFLGRVTTNVQENYFQMSWGESWQKHKNAQNEGVVRLVQVTLALISGHCHNQCQRLKTCHGMREFLSYQRLKTSLKSLFILIWGHGS